MALVHPHGKEKKLNPLMLTAGELAEEKKESSGTEKDQHRFT